MMMKAVARFSKSLGVAALVCSGGVFALGAQDPKTDCATVSDGWNQPLSCVEVRCTEGCTFHTYQEGGWTYTTCTCSSGYSSPCCNLAAGTHPETPLWDYVAEGSCEIPDCNTVWGEDCWVDYNSIPDPDVLSAICRVSPPSPF